MPYYIWDSTAAGWPAAGYRVVRYDEYGRGLSDRPDVRLCRRSLRSPTRRASRFVTVSPSESISAGVSMGGAVTAMFAGRHPHRVRSLILVDPVAGTSGGQGMFALPVVGGVLWQALAVPTMAEGQAIGLRRSVAFSGLERQISRADALQRVRPRSVVAPRDSRRHDDGHGVSTRREPRPFQCC